MTEQLNLFDFGYNDNGDYINLVEADKIAHDISEKEFIDWVNNHSDPLIRIAYREFCGYHWDGHTKNDVKEKLENIVNSKTYHYGNMTKDLYIFSLTSKADNKSVIVFENDNHYMVFACSGFYIDENKEVVDYSLDDYLLGNAKIIFPALHCPIYDLNGNRIEDYWDGNNYQKDIRHIVCMKEWRMDQYSTNRIEEGKKIKDFYEVQFRLPDLINYWGEA